MLSNKDAFTGVDGLMLTRWLRGVGALALCASAIIYMLQGVDEIGLAIRHWSYLGLTVLLAAMGVVCRQLFADAKGARVCFALAGLALAAQVSQLAGMIHAIHTSPESTLPELLAANFTALTGPTLLWSSVLTALVFLPIAYTAFAVLIRTHARALTFGFALSSCLLLMPVREGYVVYATLIAMAVVLGLYLRAVASSANATTTEGRSALGLLAVPFLIATVRSAFYLSDLTGTFLLSLVVSGLVVGLSRYWVSKGVWQDLAIAASAFVAAVSWFGFVQTLQLNASVVGAAFAAIPAAVILIAAPSRGSMLMGLHRLLGGGVVILMAYDVLFGAGIDASLLNSLQVLVVSGLVLAWALWRREKETLLMGTAAASLAAIVLLGQLVAAIDTNAWVAMGVCGVALVLSASFIERHGTASIVLLRSKLQQVQQW